MTDKKICNFCENTARNACAGCKSTFYCSKTCQNKDWVNGKHNEKCGANRNPQIGINFSNSAKPSPLEDAVSDTNMEIDQLKQTIEIKERELNLKRFFSQFDDYIDSQVFVISGGDDDSLSDVVEGDNSKLPLGERLKNIKFLERVW